MHSKLPTLLLLSLLIPAAAAAPQYATDANLAVKGLGIFHGQSHIEASVGGALYDYRLTDGPVNLTVALDDAEYELLNFKTYEFYTQPGSPIGTYDRDTSPERTVLESGTLTGTLATTYLRDDVSLRIRAIAGSLPWSAWSNSTVELLPATDLRFSSLSQSDPAINTPDAFRTLPPAAGLTSYRPDVPATLTGAVETYYYGADVLLRAPDGSTRTFQTGTFAREPVTQDDPTGNVHVREWDAVILIVHAPALRLTLSGPSWLYSLTSFTAAWDGDISLANAQGSGKINGTTIPTTQRLFQAIGSFNSTTQYADDTATWRLQGQSTFAAVDAIPLAGMRNPPTDATVAVVAVVGFGLLAFFLLRAQADPYGNRTRQELIHLIAANPGIATPALQERLGASKTTLQRHLQKLERHGIILPRQLDGHRTTTFALNHRSLEFQQPTLLSASDQAAGWTSGSTSVQAHEAMALRYSATTGPLLHAVQAGASTRPSINSWLAGHGYVPPVQSVFSKRMGEAVALGVLAQRQRPGHASEYRLNISYDAISRHQAKAIQLQSGALAPLLSHLKSNGPMMREDLLAFLRTRLPRRSDPAKTLAELLARGALSFDAGTGQYTPALVL